MSMSLSLGGGKDDDDGDEDGLTRRRTRRSARVVEIGVGVDLGTTNSAVATMMTPDGRGRASRPVMIRMHGHHVPSDIGDEDKDEDKDEEGGKRRGSGKGGGSSTTMTTIPSVVSLVPATDDNSCESTTIISGYRAHVGKEAIRHELDHPTSTYRNVKRIIGTGGGMAHSAGGIVPNLYVRSGSSVVVVEGDRGGDTMDGGLTATHSRITRVLQQFGRMSIPCT